MNVHPTSKFSEYAPRVFGLLVKTLTVFGVISLGIVIYAMYFESPIIRYQNLPFPVQTPVEQGRSVPLVIERCNDSKDERVYMSSRSLKNLDTGKETMLPEFTISVRPGCERALSRTIVIPIDTPPGHYRIEGEAITQGLIKKHRVPWYTEQFDVIKIKPLTKELLKKNAEEQ